MATKKIGFKSWAACDFCAGLAVLWLLLITPAQLLANSSTTISSIIVNRINIIDSSLAAGNVMYGWINKLHSTTREATIVRELDVAPGDELAETDIAEFERALRSLNFFSSVSVELRADENRPGFSNLIIDTQDQLSVVAGASGSFLGGVGELGFTLGERNVLGRGDRVELGFSGTTSDQMRGSVSYRDLHFINANQLALYQLGRTEEGDFLRLQFSKPFKRKSDKKSWRLLVESVQQDIDYFDAGYSVVQLPELRRVVELQRNYRRNTNQYGITRGLTVEYRDLSYDAVRGSQADTIERPSDAVQTSLGLMIGVEHSQQYIKTTGLDTLGFVQDLSFGSSVSLKLSARYSDYKDIADSTVPVLSARAMRSAKFAPDTFGKWVVNWSAALEQDKPLISGAVAFKYYKKTSSGHTLAARMDYRRVAGTAQLPGQITLGESNGLRGYANRFLTGTERVRINIEDRYDLQRRFGLFNLGLVAFLDIGWMDLENGTDLLKKSAGVGLRIGSAAMLGGRVIRMDLAYPLDEDDSELVFSAAVGQTFFF